MPTKRVNAVYDTDAHTLTFGPVSDLADTFVAELDAIFPGVIAALLKTKNGATAVLAFVNGIRQKAGDCYSSKDKVPDNLVTTAVRKIFETLAGGDWNTKGVGEGAAKMTYLLTALMEVLGTDDQEKAQGFYDARTEEEQKALPQHVKVKPVLERLKIEAAQKRQEKSAAAAKDAPDLVLEL